MTKRTLRRHTERLHSLEQSLRHMDQALRLCQKLEYRHALFRSIAMLVGMPLSCMALVFLTFLTTNFNGYGLYIGMVCAVLAWVVIQPALNQPESPLADLEARIEQLIRARERTQEELRAVLDQENIDARPGTSALPPAESEAA